MNEPMAEFVKWMEGQEHIPGSAWARAIEKARSLLAEEQYKNGREEKKRLKRHLRILDLEVGLEGRKLDIEELTKRIEKNEELEKAQAIIKDAPCHADIDALIFENNRLRAELERRHNDSHK